MVLIVAKCIVNEENFQLNSQMTAVLIVAKCIVNGTTASYIIEDLGINSSKVYCKF